MLMLCDLAFGDVIDLDLGALRVRRQAYGARKPKTNLLHGLSLPVEDSLSNPATEMTSM